MSRKERKGRSVNQLVGNVLRARGLDRDEGFAAYVGDRLLYRLGRSTEADEFYLKGGVLVGNLVDEPFRTTRDLDFLRRHGPPDPDEMRQRFHAIASVPVDDGITFTRVRAEPTDRATDDYEGVKVFVEGSVEGHGAVVKIDIGFGDVVEPPVEPIELAPFLPDDARARVRAYRAETVLAEKVETTFSKILAEHRLKDILDVVVLSDRLALHGPTALAALRATFQRRGTDADPQVLDTLRDELRGRRWETHWSTMIREKRVREPVPLTDAVARFVVFVEPLVLALDGEGDPASGRRAAPGDDHRHAVTCRRLRRAGSRPPRRSRRAS